MTARILVVDDHELNLKLVREMLTARGYEVVAAGTGEAALELARSDSPSLILLDMHLPDIDGLEVVARLKSAPETRHVPVVALTAQAMQGDDARFLAAGCDGYIPKPISTRTFAAQVERYLAGTPATREEP